ncbi:MAG TPA: hypothetical protein VKA96_00445 [Solirubrobacteraceae bacterium]|nr:hypothetical protein [Solirubrobacteraceae bacterium]
MLEGPYSDEEIDAAVAALTTPDRLAGAQDTVARFASQLQGILEDALHAGGWFGQAHEAEVSKATAVADAADRQRAVRTLIAEETRLGILVGVAVGIELARELARHPHH